MAIIAAFFVLIASFAISLWSAWRDRDRRVDTYLYAGNTKLLGISSCIGSVVSMAISFTALLSAGYVWGWQILFSIIPGCLVGLGLVLALSRHPLIAERQSAIEQQDLPDGASYLALFATRKPRLFVFYVFFLVSYAAMLLTELLVLRTFMASLTGLPGPELTLTIAVIAFVCYAYVFIGGFRGVLVTDYFQLLVVIAFIGVWVATLLKGHALSMPGPTAAHLDWSTPRLILLHVGCFSGTLAWTFASTDQWFRTFGTLPLATARRVAVTSAVTLALFVAVPVAAGSSALLRHDVPPGVTNGISLFLVRSMTLGSPAGVRFLLVMAIVCAALTTLNTYIITIQQLYYEFSIRLNANGFWTYAFTEVPAKWQNIRAVAFALLAAAFCGSLLMPERYVYAFGVLSLSTFIFAVPILVNELSASRSGRAEASETRWARRAHVALLIAIVLCVIFLVAARLFLGSITRHLYLIPAAAALATASASAAVIPFKTKVRI